jgi:putative copper resistance protein D
MSHTLIALFAITAGWSRWLELRLPKGRLAVVFGYFSPLCLTVDHLTLLNYREFS